LENICLKKIWNNRIFVWKYLINKYLNSFGILLDFISKKNFKFQIPSLEFNSKNPKFELVWFISFLILFWLRIILNILFQFSWIFWGIHNLFGIFQSTRVIWIYEKTKLPLGPPVRSTTWLNRTGQVSRPIGLTSPSLSRTNPNPKPLVIPWRWRRRHGRRHSLADSGGSRVRQRARSTQCATALLPIRIDLKLLSSTGRARALPCLGLMGSSTNSVDLGSLDKLVLFAALSSGGVWMASAWPRFGTAVAGLCHCAAMDVVVYLSSGYWFICCLWCCCLLCMLCYTDATPKPIVAMLMLV
jgi:hypothetical protein